MDFKLNDGFFDLCINESKDIENLRAILLKLYEMGYRTVALNQTVEENIFDNEKKKKKKTEDSETFPSPFNTDQLQQEFQGRLHILKRLTFVFSDSTKTHTLSRHPFFKKYHLYSVIPKTQAAYQYACSQLNTDLITINSSCTGLRMNRKLYLQAVERDVHFEIQYADMLNAEQRKLAIYHAHLFYTYGKSKNIIISSGATKVSEIRDPYDIINLGTLFGLNDVKSKASISWQSKHLLLRAERRRYGKIFAIRFEEESEDNTDKEISVKRIKSSS